MKSKWPIKRLSEVAEIEMGQSPKGSSYNTSGEGVPLINGPVEFGKTPFSRTKKTKFTTEPTKICKVGDLILCVRGSTTGRMNIAGYESCIGRGVASIRSEKYQDWINFFIHTNRETIYRLGSGATFPNVSGSMLAKLEIPIPPETEQKRLVAIVDEAFEGIDRAIANTQKNLTNARELFESYLQALDAEKKPLGSLVDIKTGKLDANAATENGQYSFFTCSRETYSIDSFAFDCEAILLAGNNAVGDFNVKHYKGKFNAYQITYVITVNKENRVLYRYLYFQLLKSLKAFKLQAVGVGTKFLKLGMIKNLQIALPTIEEQQEIVFMLDALATETQHLEAIYQQKLAALNELKQSILQKAFTGDLTADTANQTTKNAEEVVAA